MNDQLASAAVYCMAAFWCWLPRLECDDSCVDPECSWFWIHGTRSGVPQGIKEMA